MGWITGFGTVQENWFEAPDKMKDLKTFLHSINSCWSLLGLNILAPVKSTFTR